jgi:hypothetical protein
MALTPWQYASRYLSLDIATSAGTVGIKLDRYKIGDPTPAQQQLWGAVRDHFHSKGKSYQLLLTVNGVPVPIVGPDQIRMSAVRPFYGKGSPEDCQIALQLAVLLGLTTSNHLQNWCDANLGLDCNGFVGNYLSRVVLGVEWQLDPIHPGPSTDIQRIFRWAAGSDESGALDDLSKVDPDRKYILCKVDPHGNVMPGGPHSAAGHISITEPGEFMRQSFVSNSMGGIDLTTAQEGMYGKFAVRTIEAAGPQGVPGMGIGRNWTVFIKQLSQAKNKVFEIRRDRYRHPTHIKIAPIPR